MPCPRRRDGPHSTAPPVKLSAGPLFRRGSPCPNPGHRRAQCGGVHLFGALDMPPVNPALRGSLGRQQTMDFARPRVHQRRRDKLPVQPVQNVWNKTRQTFDAPRYKVNGHGIPPYEFSAGIGTGGGGFTISGGFALHDSILTGPDSGVNRIAPLLDFTDRNAESQKPMNRGRT